MIYADTIKLPKSPVDQEYMKQKREVADKFCRHLKGLEKIKQFDYDNDEVISALACKQCGRILSPAELAQREQTLLKFKK